MDNQIWKIAGQDLGSLFLVILYGVYSEVKRYLEKKKSERKIEEAKNVTVSCRASDLQNVHRRLKLVELEDKQHANKSSEYKSDEVVETRNFINGFVLTLEGEIQRNIKEKLREDNQVIMCPNKDEVCVMSSMIIGESVTSYNNALGKVAKRLKDYIWSVILLNGFYELDEIQLESYISGKGKTLWTKIGDEMEVELPKNLAIEYDKIRITKAEAVKFTGKLINGIIEIKTRYEKKHRKSLKLHNEILEKIYSDNDEDDDDN